jgi:hypothetical protein
MNPTAAYFAQLKEYAANQRRCIEETCQQSPDILPCPFHTLCFYEKTLGRCKEWTLEPIPDWISPDYEENVTEWHTNTTDIPLVTINELTKEHDGILASTLRQLLGQRRNPLYQLNNQGANLQPSTPPREILLPTATNNSLEIPVSTLWLVNPAGHTPAHRYPLRSLDKRATVKDVTSTLGSPNLGRVAARRERHAPKPYGCCRK